MRILLFSLDFPPRVGGIETVALMLSKHFSAFGAEVTVVTEDHPNAEALDLCHSFAVRRIAFGSPESAIQKVTQKIALVRQLNDIIAATNPDLVLCAHWDPCAFITKAASSKVPYFLIVHGTELLQLPENPVARRAKKALLAYSFSGAQTIFAVSNYTRKRAIEAGATPLKVVVIPNGVETIETEIGFRVKPAEETGASIVTVARLVSRKGHEIMLRALPKVLSHVPGARYTIVGDGPERAYLEALTADLKLHSSVSFLGEVPDAEKREVLASSDVFVFPCRETSTDFEGFGIALLEAMQYAKPIVATRSGGITDIVIDGETGLLVASNDVDGLANAVLSILNNPRRSVEMGNHGRARVQDRFRWESIAERYLVAMDAALFPKR